MLHKFPNVYKLSPFSCRGRPRKLVAQPQQELGESDQGISSALKIVHAGGAVECYYVAIPAAAHIMKKYPSFILARPQVFRRPWDSLVQSDEILTPGEKLYLVPRQTVRKLQQRLRKPKGEVSVSSFVSQSSIDVSKDGFSSNLFLLRNEVSDSSEAAESKMGRRNMQGLQPLMPSRKLVCLPLKRARMKKPLLRVPGRNLTLRPQDGNGSLEMVFHGSQV